MEQRKAEEAKKELEEKKSEERKAAEKLKAIPASGASTKGTNTPSHRPGKHLDAAQRPVSSTSQKRPGSPNLSEASGNESTRKKPKKKHATSSNLATGVSTPNGPVPRTRSPAPPTSSAPEPTTGRPTPPPQLVQRKNERPGTTTVSHKRDRLAGSGSDGEAASGGEMSDRRNKRPRLKANAAGSKSGSPRGSRAASPDARPVNPGQCSLGSVAASRELNDVKAPPPRFPTAAEIKAVIPPEGTTIKALSMIFRQQIQDPVALKRFTELLKSICRVDKATKALFPKD
jgi:transcription initiation factor TFIIF subunit alpha